MNWRKTLNFVVFGVGGLIALTIALVTWLWNADDRFASKYILEIVADVGTITDLKKKYTHQNICSPIINKIDCTKKFVEEVGEFRNSTQLVFATAVVLGLCIDKNQPNYKTAHKQCMISSINYLIDNTNFKKMFSPLNRAPSSITRSELKNLERTLNNTYLYKTRERMAAQYKKEKDSDFKSQYFDLIIKIDAKIIELQQY